MKRLLRREGAHLGVALAIVMGGLLPFMGTSSPAVSQSSPPVILGQALRTMTWNVNGPKWDKFGPIDVSPEDVAQEIRRLRVDVVGFQEIGAGQFRAVRDALGSSWDGIWNQDKTVAACSLVLNQNCEGNGILTRHLFSDGTYWELPTQNEFGQVRKLQRIMIHPSPQYDFGVLFYNTHLSQWGACISDVQAQRIGSLVEADLSSYGSDTPALVVGDFNLRPWERKPKVDCQNQQGEAAIDPMGRLRSDGFRDSWAEGWPESVDKKSCREKKAGPDRGTSAARSCGWTYRGDDYARLRIDYILAWRNAGVTGFVDRYTPWASGDNDDVARFSELSDHFPVVATVFVTDIPSL